MKGPATNYTYNVSKVCRHYNSHNIYNFIGIRKLFGHVMNVKLDNIDTSAFAYDATPTACMNFL